MIAWFSTMNPESSPTATRPGLSVVIPVYNSAATLEPLINELQSFFQSHNFSAEVILVNDGSRDPSWEVARHLAARHPHVTALNLFKNSGQHVALLTGLKVARGHHVITMDDDLQHPPAEIPKLLAALDAGADVVYGVPEEDHHSLWRTLASCTTKMILQRFVGIQHAEDTSAFRAVRGDILEPFRAYDSHYVDIDALLAWVTDRFTSVRVRHDPRRHGRSNYTPWSLLRHTVKMVVCFTTVPLRIASVIGFLFTLAGLAALIYVLINYAIHGSAVPGFAFVACAIAIFSGAQLFSLGILGEYFAKIHFRIMGRPGGLVRERVGGGNSKP